MKPENTNFRIECKGDTAEIFLYDIIGEDFFGGITAKMFADEMGKAKSARSIDLRINSPGGDVFAGFTIYTLLKSAKAQVNVFIDGLAASIASVIAMAGDSIEMADTSMMMIHDPWAMVVGDAAEMRQQADLLDKVASQIVGTYSAKTNLPGDEIRAMMQATTWMTGAEAVAKGFADVASEAPAIAALLPPESFKYKNIPASLVQPQATAEEIAMRQSKSLRDRIQSEIQKGRALYASL